MAKNEPTTSSSKKRAIIIAVIFAVLLASFISLSFKSCSRNESPGGGQGITGTEPTDEGKDKEDADQEDHEGIEQADGNEQGPSANYSENSAGNMTQSNSGDDDISGNLPSGGNDQLNGTNNGGTNGGNGSDHPSSGSPEQNGQTETVPNPDKPIIPEDNGDESVSILNLLYNELIKANKTFQYLLEMTNEILGNY